MLLLLLLPRHIIGGGGGGLLLAGGRRFRRCRRRRRPQCRGQRRQGMLPNVFNAARLRLLRLARAREWR